MEVPEDTVTPAVHGSHLVLLLVRDRHKALSGWGGSIPAPEPPGSSPRGDSTWGPRRGHPGQASGRVAGTARAQASTGLQTGPAWLCAYV